MKNPWTGLQTWEVTFAGQHGPDAYRDVVSGRVENRRSAIGESFELPAGFMELADDDAV